MLNKENLTSFIKVSNHLEIDNPTEKVIYFCEEKLILDNPEYLDKKRMGLYCGDVPKKIQLFSKKGSTYVLPYGCWKNLHKLDSKLLFKSYLHKKIGSVLKSVPNSKLDLYDYQEKACNSLIKEQNGILVAPCGSGKTQIGLELINRLHGRALWLTHTKELLTQSKERCENYFIGDFGTITEGKCNIGKDITFATVQTLSKLDKSLYENEFDIIVVDEAHRVCGSPTKLAMFYKVIDNCNARYKYGLTATPKRADGLIKSLFSLVGDIVYTIDEKEVGDKRIKAIQEAVLIEKKYNMAKYLSTDGKTDYAKLIKLLCEDQERNTIITNKIIDRQKEGNHKQLVLVDRVKHAKELKKILLECSCECKVITGKSKDRNFKDCNIIISTYALAKEGLDIKELDTLHSTMPKGRKTSVIEQSVGRIERNIEGKETPIMYDYVDKNIAFCVKKYNDRRRLLKRNGKIIR